MISNSGAVKWRRQMMRKFHLIPSKRGGTGQRERSVRPIFGACRYYRPKYQFCLLSADTKLAETADIRHFGRYYRHLSAEMPFLPNIVIGRNRKILFRSNTKDHQYKNIASTLYQHRINTTSTLVMHEVTVPLRIKQKSMINQYQVRLG